MVPTSDPTQVPSVTPTVAPSQALACRIAVFQINWNNYGFNVTIINSNVFIKCDGSCSYESIDNRIIALNDRNIYFSGAYSGRNVDIVQTTHDYDICCNG